MSTIPQGLLYTENHEWIKVEGDLGTVGITDYAQHALGDVTFVDLPEVGKEVAQGDEACAVESCKAAANVFAPVSGKVVEANAALADDPARIDADCYGEGWIYKLALRDKAELSKLKTAEQYAQMLASEA
jgi:glycine cleavage system H protein